MITVGDLLVEFTEHWTSGDEPPVLTLTERNGLVHQADRFSKRLATEDTSKYKVVRRHDIAFNPYLLWAGAIAQNTIADVGIISPLYPTFRVRDGYDPRYVARLVLSRRMISLYDTIAFGSVPRRRRSSVQDFLALALPSPPCLPEQRRIAALLDRVERVRADEARSLALLEELPRAIFLEMFGGRSTSLQPVEMVARNEKNSIRTGPFGSQLLHSEFVHEGIAVLGIDNVSTNHFRWSERRFITPEKYEKLKRFTVTPGDVLITIMGSCGKCVVVPDGIPTAINTKHLCAISVDRQKVLPEFLRACFLWHPESRRFLLRQTNGSVMDGLNMGIIKSMPMPVPPIDLQVEFVRRQHASERQHELAARSSAVAEELLESIQGGVFSGNRGLERTAG